MRIAVDAFGGDNAPLEIVKGAAAASNEYGVETIVPDATMFLYSAIIAILVFIPLLILKKKGLDKKEA